MFLAFLWFSQDACYVDERIHFPLILNGFGLRKSGKNRWKIDGRCGEKLDATWDGFGRPLGSIFPWFWKPKWLQTSVNVCKNQCQKALHFRLHVVIAFWRMFERFVVGDWNDAVGFYACVPCNKGLAIVNQGIVIKICRTTSSARNYISKHQKRRK